MYQTVNFTDFVNAFRAHDRMDQFSYDAMRALFNHFEEIEDDTGEQMELDVIEICCEWYEATADEIREEYSNMIDEDDVEFTDDRALRDWLNYHSFALEAGNGAFVFVAF